MRLTVLATLFIPLVAAQTAFHSCGQNELCVHLNSCPAFKQYTKNNVPLREWPANAYKFVSQKLCNQERVGQNTIYSVCCRSAMNNARCGQVVTHKISNGQEAEPFEFPWMALLQNSKQKFVCGGTLISSRFVLTAAHCVTDAAKIQSVRLGENDITKNPDCLFEKECAPQPQDIKVIETFRHQGYSAREKKNDIALLKLQHPATLGHSVRTICLPNRTRKQRAFIPSSLIVSGWGMNENNKTSDVLRYAHIPLVPPKQCAPRVKEMHSFLKLGKGHVCAGGVNKVSNCYGDSGGPLQYFYDPWSRYVQHGIVSYGLNSCGVKSAPGVYTKVEHYIDWILEHVNE